MKQAAYSSAVTVAGGRAEVQRVKRKNSASARAKRAAYTVVMYLMLTVLAVFLLFPFFYMVMRSFMPGWQVMHATEIIPKEWVLEGWKQLFVGDNYLRYAGKTLIIVAFNIIAIPLSASFVAYGFAKLQYVGKNIVFGVMMATMMLPGTVLQTPLFILFSKFNWLDTILPLTIPNLFGGGALYIFLIRQYMIGIPKELDEAARIDGASMAIRFLRITFPLCQPILIFIVVTVFGTMWSDFYSPLIYMSGAETPTLALAVYLETTSSSGKYVTADKANIRMAMGTFMAIPPAVLFVIFQKQLIEGVATSALKG